MSDVAQEAPVVEEVPARIEVKVWHAVTYVMEGDQLVVGPDQVYQGGAEGQMINSTTGRVVEQKTTPVTEASVAAMLVAAPSEAPAPSSTAPGPAPAPEPPAETPVSAEAPAEEVSSEQSSSSGSSRSRRL
jgi:hypothetical protein